MAGPDNPPVKVFRLGFLVLISIDSPGTVLIKDIASEPESSTVFENNFISETFGDSLVMRTALFTESLTFVTSLPSIFLSEPKAIPPFFTFGQDTFNSMASTPASSRASEIIIYSLIVLPRTFTTILVSNFLRKGNLSLRKCFKPTF